MTELIFLFQVNERVAISVSSSPVSSQVVGVGAGGEYVVSGRGDRQRISLLPAPASIAPAASPTAPTDYHAAAAAVARNSRVSAGAPPPPSPAGLLAAMQPQDYRPSSVDMAQQQQQSQQQEAPPFKKIRLGQPTQLVPSTQQHSISGVNVMSHSEVFRNPVQDTLIIKQRVQTPQLQPLRIDTRVR